MAKSNETKKGTTTKAETKDSNKAKGTEAKDVVSAKDAKKVPLIHQMNQSSGLISRAGQNNLEQSACSQGTLYFNTPADLFYLCFYHKQPHPLSLYTGIKAFI
jgi:hypothetical protein